MATQSTYLTEMAAAYHGMIANTEPNVLISRSAESAINFGSAVIQGTADGEADFIAAKSNEIVGIAVIDNSADPATVDAYAVGASMLLMRKGVLWVTVTDAGGVAAGDPVWLKVVAGAANTYANADVTSTGGSILLNDARWETTAANGALAKIRFNLDTGVTAGA